MKKTLALILLPLLALQDAEPGLVAEYFQLSGAPGSLPTIPSSVKPTYVRLEPSVNYAEGEGDFHGTRLSENFYARWTGILRAEKDGKYQFWTESDDGSKLTIDGKVVVDNGGSHPMTVKGGVAELTAGDHELKLEYFQGGGGAGCRMSWEPPGGPRQGIPAKALFHKKGAEKVEWDETAWKKRKSAPKKGGGKFAEMDHGPFAAGTIDSLWGGKGNFANKGIAIRLDAEKNAHVCFDPEQ